MDKIKLNIYTRKFLEGKLPPEKEKELFFWVSANNENREQFLKEQENLSPLIIAEPGSDLSEKWKELQQRAYSNGSKNKTWPKYYRIASIAAAFLVGVLLTVFITNKVSKSSIQITQQEIYVPYGAKTNITLPDGSLVWLNSGSSLTYPSKFRKERPVKLNGEAYFKVEKDNKPFIVSTQFGDVEVKGTSFNVQAFEDETFHATLVNGSVLVRGKQIQKEVILRPGQQANFSNGKLNIIEVETEIFTSWKDGQLIFRKEYLPVVAHRLEKWYNVKIELEEDKRLNDIWFTGTLEMETFSEVMELLKVTSPIDYSYNEKTRTIRIKYKQK